MKKILILLYISIGIQIAKSQEIYANEVFNFNENSIQKVFTENARIRFEPSLKSKILDSLQTNENVKISKKETALKIGERIANWYLVSFFKENRKVKGYIWGGNLAIGHTKKNGFDFLFGIPKTEEKNNKKKTPSYAYTTNIGAVKMMKNKHRIDEQFFETGTGEALVFSELKIEPNNQLTNIDFVLRATTSGEACGIPTYDQYFLVAQNKMIPLPKLTSVADAGYFSHIESFIFPLQKGGKTNAILLKTIDEETDENTQKTKSKKSVVKYTWNGNSIKKI